MSKHTPYWFRVINNAIKRKAAGEVPFTREHNTKARDWVTCACGRQDPRIPRKVFSGRGEPFDTKLTLLGANFAMDLLNDCPNAALTTLLKIEKRAAEVLAEVNDGA